MSLTEVGYRYFAWLTEQFYLFPKYDASLAKIHVHIARCITSLFPKSAPTILEMKTLTMGYSLENHSKSKMWFASTSLLDEYLENSWILEWLLAFVIDSTLILYDIRKSNVKSWHWLPVISLLILIDFKEYSKRSSHDFHQHFVSFLN